MSARPTKCRCQSGLLCICDYRRNYKEIHGLVGIALGQAVAGTVTDAPDVSPDIAAQRMEALS